MDGAAQMAAMGFPAAAKVRTASRTAGQSSRCFVPGQPPGRISRSAPAMSASSARASARMVTPWLETISRRPPAAARMTSAPARRSGSAQSSASHSSVPSAR